MPKELVNLWPKELEDEFQRRAHQVIKAQTTDIKAGVNTYFENEKRTYGYLMAHVLGGNSETALKYLRARDHQHEEWHRETAGIDYYTCFTLKHQMRKYFYFGDLLEPGYRKQMFDGARRWTAKDPLRRPHYAHKGKKEGWGYKASDGKWLGIHWNDDPLNLGVWRNGKRTDLSDSAFCESPIVRSEWGSGILEVITPSAKFRCEVDVNGGVRFE